MFTPAPQEIKEKCCRKCFAYVPAKARKCKHCKYVFKSPAKFIFDKLKGAFNINKVYAANESPAQEAEAIIFTDRELEELFQPKNVKILMYLVLSDYNYLDENSLIELGETLSSM